MSPGERPAVNLSPGAASLSSFLVFLALLFPLSNKHDWFGEKKIKKEKKSYDQNGSLLRRFLHHLLLFFPPPPPPLPPPGCVAKKESYGFGYCTWGRGKSSDTAGRPTCERAKGPLGCVLGDRGKDGWSSGWTEGPKSQLETQTDRPGHRDPGSRRKHGTCDALGERSPGARSPGTWEGCAAGPGPPHPHLTSPQGQGEQGSVGSVGIFWPL